MTHRNKIKSYSLLPFNVHKNGDAIKEIKSIMEQGRELISIKEIRTAEWDLKGTDDEIHTMRTGIKNVEDN